MPQAAAWAVAGWFASAGLSAAAIAYGVTYVIVYAAIVVGLQKAADALTPKPKGSSNGGGPITANYSGTSEPVRIIYGRLRVGGMNVIPAVTSGANGERLLQVVAIAGTEIDGYEDVYFGEEQIFHSNITSVVYAANDGSVTQAPYNGYAYIRRYTGTPTQLADYDLQATYPTAFNASFRGRGIAYVATTLVWNKNVWNGPPPTLSFVVRGRKVYDPRKDSSKAGGSGAHRDDNPSTWEFSKNPALILRDYMTLPIGGAYAHADIDDSLVMAAANVCDQTVTTPTGAKPRYTCNVVLNTASGNDELLEANLQTLVESMQGRVMEVDGKLLIFAGTWEPPQYSIQRGDWIGALELEVSSPRESRWNAVRVFYTDSARQYQRNECYPRRNAGYVADDGGEEFYLDVNAPACDNEFEAQRHGEMWLRRGRNQIKLSGTLGPKGIVLRPHDTVSVTDSRYGWSGKTFRIMTLEPSPEGGIGVSMVEEGSAMWADLSAGEYNAPSSPLQLDPGATSPQIPSSFTVDALANKLKFSWAAGQYDIEGHQYRLYQTTVGSIAATTSPAWQGNARNVELAADPRTPYYYHLQGVLNGVVGPAATVGPIRPYARMEGDTTNRLFQDGEFTILSGSYWVFYNVTNWILQGSGGISDGRGCLVTSLDVSHTSGNPQRAVPLRFDDSYGYVRNGFRVNPGQTVNVYVGYARVDSTATGGFRVNVYAAKLNNPKGNAGVNPFQLGSIYCDITSYAVDEWRYQVGAYTISNSGYDIVTLELYHRNVDGVDGRVKLGLLQASVF